MKQPNKAEREFKQLLTKRDDLESQDVVRIFIKYGFFLDRKYRETEDEDSDVYMKQSMDFLYKAVDLAAKTCVLTDDDGHTTRFNSGLWDLPKAIERYERHLLENCDDARFLTKEEALMYLGWLKFTLRDNDDIKLESCTTHLEYYQRAYHSATSESAKPPKECMEQILHGLINCHILQGNFDAVGKYIDDLRNFDGKQYKQRRADWKLAEGKSVPKEDQKAHDLFLDAVRCGSIAASEKLIEWLENRHQAGDEWQDIFTISCAEILHYISEDDLLVVDTQMATLSFVKHTQSSSRSQSDTQAEEKNDTELQKRNIEDRINSLLDLENKPFGELRRKRLQMERSNLSGSNDLVEKCGDVLRVARPLLDHVTNDFGKKHYGKGAYYPYIRRGTLRQNTVEDELVKDKLKSWKDFKSNHPSLLKFLVQVSVNLCAYR